MGVGDEEDGGGSRNGRKQVEAVGDCANGQVTKQFAQQDIGGVARGVGDAQGKSGRYQFAAIAAIVGCGEVWGSGETVDTQGNGGCNKGGEVCGEGVVVSFCHFPTLNEKLKIWN